MLKGGEGAPVPKGAARLLCDAWEFGELQRPLGLLREAIRGFFPAAASLGARRSPRDAELSLVHGAYLLVARCEQALALLEVLCGATVRFGAGVQWERLSGLSFCELVCDGGAHARVAKLLDDLVAPWSPPALLAYLTAALSERCFHFFSAADRLFLDAMRALDEAAKLPGQSPRRAALVEESARGLERSARHWRSPPTAGGSRLERSCAALCALGRHDAIVRLCIANAAAFAHGAAAAAAEGAADGWEARLYHARGTGASPEARAACYRVAVDALDRLLSPELRGGPEGGAPPMGAAACEEMAGKVLDAVLASGEGELQAMVYERLRFTDATRLLKLRHPSVEAYLSTADRDLYFRHLFLLQRHAEAARVMLDLATAEADTPILERCEYLLRAKGAADKCLASGEALPEDLRAVDDTWEVASLQRDVLAALERKWGAGGGEGGGPAADNKRSQRAFDLRTLRNQLLPVSDIYNDFASRYCAFGQCLRIIKTCDHFAPEVVKRLWRGFVWREVPAASGQQGLAQWLREKHEERRQWFCDEDHPEPKGSFEDGDWWAALLHGAAHFLALLRDNDGGALGLDVLALELEDIHFHRLQARQDPHLAKPNAVVAMIAGSGVHRAPLLRVYTQIFNDRRDAPFFALHTLDQIAALLSAWVDQAAEDSPEGHRASAELNRAKQDDLLRTLNDLIEAVSASGLGSPEGTEARASQLRSIKGRVTNM